MSKVASEKEVSLFFVFLWESTLLYDKYFC